MSFLQRNPDVNVEDIQNNKNLQDAVKAHLSYDILGATPEDSDDDDNKQMPEVTPKDYCNFHHIVYICISIFQAVVRYIAFP